MRDADQDAEEYLRGERRTLVDSPSHPVHGDACAPRDEPANSIAS